MLSESGDLPLLTVGVRHVVFVTYLIPVQRVVRGRPKHSLTQASTISLVGVADK